MLAKKIRLAGLLILNQVLKKIGKRAESLAEMKRYSQHG
jgi:hypothetical protein